MTRMNLSLFIIAIILTTGCTYSQTSSGGPDEISFQQIPYELPDIISPGRGAEQWHNGSEAINYPTADSLQTSMDVYFRFTWNMLEDSVQGSYNWSFFDGLIHDAIDKGQKLSFGIMSCYGDDAAGVIRYDNGRSAYPLYLHQLMQRGGPDEQDWQSDDSTWIPNWNSPHYLSRLRALHEALYAHINNSSYTPQEGPKKGQPIPFANAIYCIDVRGYGNYGEWHNSGIVKHTDDYPKGRKASEATLKTIIDHHTQVFDKWPLVMMIAAFDAGQINTIMNPVEVGHYALTTRNTWGLLGWRRDQWGATDGYLNKILKDNHKKNKDGERLNELITSRYQTSPVTGEPPRYVNKDGRCAYWDLEQQVKEYGASSVGNGNWGTIMNECAQKNARNAFKRSGYRIILEKGNIPPVIEKAKTIQLSLQWKNIGVAPTYEEWDVIFTLKNKQQNIVWSGLSQFKPKLFLPQEKGTTVTDQFILPGDLPDGDYELELVIKDPSGYRAPLPLAIAGRNADGGYLLQIVKITTPGTSN